MRLSVSICLKPLDRSAQISCVDALCLWLGPPPAAVHYVMYFRFYRLRHTTAAATPVTRATAAVKLLKRKRVPTARPQDSMKVMIGLQNKQLQLERERLRVEREKLACITGIQGELTAIHFTLCHLADVSFEPVPITEE